ncbi:hypothetical protein [Bauldia sp.]|uniref:hypothetical protein n=1 Tax=Bauldia sp. TaxID=2575872 RepID=UPI003BAC6C75
MSIVQRVEGFLDTLSPIVKWLLPFVTLFALLGLVFNALLAGKLGFDPPATFDLADHFPSGLFMSIEALWQTFSLLLDALLLASVLLALVFFSYLTHRILVKSRHDALFASARELGREERDTRQIAPPGSALSTERGVYLRRESRRRFLGASALRKKYPWLKKETPYWRFFRTSLRDFFSAFLNRVQPKASKAAGYLGRKPLVFTWGVVILVFFVALLIGPARVDAYIDHVVTHTRVALVPSGPASAEGEGIRVAAGPPESVVGRPVDPSWSAGDRFGQMVGAMRDGA